MSAPRSLSETACYDGLRKKRTRNANCGRSVATVAHEADIAPFGGGGVLRDIAILQRTKNRLRGKSLVPKGIYRFSSHEDADSWMMKQIVANHVRPSSKI